MKASIIRSVVTGAAVCAGMAMAVPTPGLAQQSITVSSWGGAFQKAQREAWFIVVEKELGITIKEDTTSGIADIRAQVASGRPTWDLSTQGTHTCGILEKEGKLEKLDPVIINDAGVTISNGKGATITLIGPTVSINSGALTIVGTSVTIDGAQLAPL